MQVLATQGFFRACGLTAALISKGLKPIAIIPIRRAFCLTAALISKGLKLFTLGFLVGEPDGSPDFKGIKTREPGVRQRARGLTAALISKGLKPLTCDHPCSSLRLTAALISKGLKPKTFNRPTRYSA